LGTQNDAFLKMCEKGMTAYFATLDAHGNLLYLEDAGVAYPGCSGSVSQFRSIPNISASMRTDPMLRCGHCGSTLRISTEVRAAVEKLTCPGCGSPLPLSAGGG